MCYQNKVKINDFAMCLFIVYFSFEFSMSSLESEIKYFLCLTHIITNQIITNNQGIAMGPTREETQRETTIGTWQSSVVEEMATVGKTCLY